MEEKHGFIYQGKFYEDKTLEQEELLSSPITEEEHNTLLGYFKQIWQKN